MQLEGKIKLIMETETFDSGFTKREFVITTDDTYPQDVKFETIKDKTSLLDSLKVGQAVTVHINIRGNEFNGKYYVSLQAWKIDAGEVNKAPANQPVTNITDDEDLPF